MLVVTWVAVLVLVALGVSVLAVIGLLLTHQVRRHRQPQIPKEIVVTSRPITDWEKGYNSAPV